MQRYRILEQLGDGSFGTVCKAQDVETGEMVAIKAIKKRIVRWQDALALREVKALTTLKKHPNLVRLKQLVHENHTVYFVFEYCTSNLYQVALKSSPLEESTICKIMHQLLSGLSHMHKHGFFHRDIKPENLLLTGVTQTGSNIFDMRRIQVKLADLGLAREIRSRPPYTDYVATRWYRAPELLLRSGPGHYSSAVDIWAAGCIMGELISGRPLAAGNTEANQFFKLCSLLGSPSSREWPQGIRLVQQAGLVLPTSTDSKDDSLERLCSGANPHAMDLLRQLLAWNPARRPTAAAALRHAYFHKEIKEVTEDLSSSSLCGAAVSLSHVSSSTSCANSIDTSSSAPLDLDSIQNVLTTFEPLPTLDATRQPDFNHSFVDESSAQLSGSEKRLVKPDLPSDTSLDASAFMDLLNELEAEKCV